MVAKKLRQVAGVVVMGVRVVVVRVMGGGHVWRRGRGRRVAMEPAQPPVR